MRFDAGAPAVRRALTFRSRKMSVDAILVGLLAFGAVIGIFYLYKMIAAEARRKAAETALLSKTLAEIELGKSKINFVLTTIPFALSGQEKGLAAFPNMTLLKSKSIQVSQGRRQGSSVRFKRVSFSSGSRATASETRDLLRPIDTGTLIVTNRRVTFLGVLKTLSFEVDKLLAVDSYADAVGLHVAGQEKVESFKVPEALKLKCVLEGQDLAIPVGGQILGRIIRQAMTAIGDRGAIVAA